MTQHLIWNFECTKKSPFLLADSELMAPSELKWEARFFWDDKSPIALTVLDEGQLDLNNYKNKHKLDYYYLLPDSTYNIKQRKEQLLYKPILERTEHAIGFGKKINLEAPDADLNDSQNTPELLKKILLQAKTQALIIPVKKESYTYKLPTNPTIKLELARLEVHNKIYFSACIEGRSRLLVERISTQLFKDQKACDYVHFLNLIQKT